MSTSPITKSIYRRTHTQNHANRDLLESCILETKRQSKLNKKLLLKSAAVIQYYQKTNQVIPLQIRKIIERLLDYSEDDVNKLMSYSIHRNKIFSYFNPFFTRSLSDFLLGLIP